METGNAFWAITFWLGIGLCVAGLIMRNGWLLFFGFGFFCMGLDRS